MKDLSLALIQGILGVSVIIPLYDPTLSLAIRTSSESNILSKYINSQSIEYNGHIYQLINLEKTWLEANKDCERRGGHLVTISSEEENNFVSNLAGSQNIWIGLTDEIHEGSWQWVNGESLTYTNWDSEEPNNSGPGEDYGMMYDNGLWNDAGPPGTPEEAYPYVCEWDNRSSNIYSDLFSLGVRIFLFVIISVLMGYRLFKTRNK
ncbi:MAG: C-type lectin domain-containing protein [Candidatus Hodarchaeota archaeon]